MTNATFVCERAHAELRSAESLEAVAACYLRQGAPKRAYSILQGSATTPHGRYLLAVACIKLEKPHEAEAALLPDRHLRTAGPEVVEHVPHGAAGLYALGVACQRTHRREHAIEYFKLSLREDPLMWVSFEALCSLGAAVDVDAFFGGGAVDDDGAVANNGSWFEGDEEPAAAAPKKLFDTPVESVARAMCFDSVADESPPTKVVVASPSYNNINNNNTNTNVVRSDESSVEKPPSKIQRRVALLDDLAKNLLVVLRRLAVAREAMSRNRCDDALRALHAVPARHFETGWVLNAVGRAHLESADYDAAVAAFRRMERAEPHRMQGLELLSTALWHLKDDVDLCYLARRCVDFDPRAPEPWCAAGNCLSLQKEHDSAIRCFQRAIAVDPRFAYAYTLCGHEYVANEDFEKAVAMYRHAMRVDDRHYNAWYGLGAIYYRQEKYELAEYHFERALALNPQSSVLHCFSEDHQLLTNRGFLFLDEVIARRRRREKEDDLLFATYDPKTQHILYARPRAVVVNSKKKKTRMIEFDDDSSSVSLLVTPEHEMYARRKDDASFKKLKAIDLLGQESITMLACAPKNGRRRVRVGGSKNRKLFASTPRRRDELCLQLFNAGYAAHSTLLDDGTTWCVSYDDHATPELGATRVRQVLNYSGRTWCATMDHGFVVARRVFKDRTSVPLIQGNCYLGMTLHANKKCDDALAHLERAAAMEPKNPQARFQCANVLMSMDRYDQALEELKAVCDHAPREASVHFLMGKICKRLGKLEDAMMHFTFALDLEPKDNNLIKSAIDRLEEPDIDEDEKF
ncbi:hypothetical protein CTAYLR_002059 [Chrysophaeum taylorii]|uniref:Uncharacterized protein n=1 Tax=Chrysophaeum taylorii TaxID=2483200 RepID=A0AAD7XRB8_9STRA|nr:hypothetical protein CTAYLR_002059 [Chrysophaeum taylorii]